MQGHKTQVYVPPANAEYLIAIRKEEQVGLARDDQYGCKKNTNQHYPIQAGCCFWWWGFHISHTKATVHYGKNCIRKIKSHYYPP
tara:strand:+ start:116 stop:370 length:255 start_codon:yes stop_codon:yes gene_type:complete